MPHFIIRPISKQDYPGLQKLVNTIKSGVASLPKDPKLLKGEIANSEQSFQPNLQETGKEYYLFVLEEIKTQKIIGLSGIFAHISGNTFFYAYKVETETFKHAPLGIDKKVKVLHLEKIHKGPTEMCSLFLDNNFRKSGLGRLLSLSRYLFIAAFPNRFDEELVALLRGYQSANRKFPFWRAVGKHFFEGKLPTFDTMKSLGHKKFITDLMPRHPIYVPLLPPAAQSCIGEVHPNTAPALHLLKTEGYRKSNLVDILDAGPFMTAKRKDIRTIREHRKAKISKITPPQNRSSPLLIANQSLDFRACLGNLEAYNDGTIGLPENLANALGVTKGKSIAFVTVK